MIDGNKNTYLESKKELDHPVWASKVRFLPYSPYMRTVCMRVEVYGCYWNGKFLILIKFKNLKKKIELENVSSKVITSIEIYSLFFYIFRESFMVAIFNLKDDKYINLLNF